LDSIKVVTMLPIQQRSAVISRQTHSFSEIGWLDLGLSSPREPGVTCLELKNLRLGVKI